jgi:hydroxypyruvate isomerase
VYNADSSLFSQVSDFVHKVVSSETYQCNLCGIIYGHIGMKQEWKTFIQSLPMAVEFLHKDEFTRQYPQLKNSDLPAIFLSDAGQTKSFITADEINSVHTIDGLIKLVNVKLDMSTIRR